ncbi:lasso peptide biosynthesis B2 protein [Lentzea aerocolonigenes]|uniref:lasso peptide biosynthesis B2 protein n=1 Tax=Lentzea aerocolonigenes TaxID=68170 RepID=UPI000AD8ED61
MATGAPERPALAGTLAGACCALIVGLALRCLPLKYVTAVARWLSAWAKRPAAVNEAERVLRWIDSGSRLIPFRVACLERSLVALLLLSLRRRGVIWRMGVRTPPFASHAWICDLDGQPIGEADSTADYRTMLEISPLTELKRRSS